MRAYELTLVLRPSLKEDERKKVLSAVKGFFSDAKFSTENDWGEKTLSYPVKKETSGYYVHMMLETEGELPTDFDKRLLTNDNVLRHLFLKSNVKGQKAKASDEKSEKPVSKVKVEKKTPVAKPAPKTTKPKTVKKAKKK